ncbi:MAG: hypothetical protein OES20_03520 [Gammaproteobacteria bacterium]|nr:hypothetical protein [Gammaproteobacteria bacterium]MDH3858065.1 hypothetical protein [Gammaproteobacteria bacterium]
MFFFLLGVSLLAAILGLFWIKDRLQSPVLARIAFSEPIARLAVVAAVFIVLGLLLFLSDFSASVLE